MMGGGVGEGKMPRRLGGLVGRLGLLIGGCGRVRWVRLGLMIKKLGLLMGGGVGWRRLGMNDGRLRLVIGGGVDEAGSDGKLTRNGNGGCGGVGWE